MESSTFQSYGSLFVVSVPGGKVEDSDNESDDYDDDDIDVEDYIMFFFLEIILCVIPIKPIKSSLLNRDDT